MTTIKQKQFVKRYIENGGNGTQAAMDVYNAKNYNTAHAIAVDNLQKPTIRREIEQAMEAKGLTNEYISELLKEATVAGLGQKATNSDTLRGLELMLRVKDAFPSKVQKTAHLRIDYKQEKEELMKMSAKELELELKNTLERTKELMDDISS